MLLHFFDMILILLRQNLTCKRMNELLSSKLLVNVGGHGKSVTALHGMVLLRNRLEFLFVLLIEVVDQF